MSFLDPLIYPKYNIVNMICSIIDSAEIALSCWLIACEKTIGNKRRLKTTRYSKAENWFATRSLYKRLDILSFFFEIESRILLAYISKRGIKLKILDKIISDIRPKYQSEIWIDFWFLMYYMHLKMSLFQKLIHCILYKIPHNLEVAVKGPSCTLFWISTTAIRTSLS